MTPARRRHAGFGQRQVAWLVAVLGGCLISAAAGAQTWQELDAQQRAALAPLQAQWAGIDPDRRDQWLALARRFPSLDAAERSRMQARMADWARLTPDERGSTRLQFNEAQRWTPEERQQRWEAYQSLHPQARQILAHRWKLEEASRAKAAAAPPTKQNLVEKPAPTSEPPRAASPTTVRARSGATSRPITRAPAPGPTPAGAPKVAATPPFVDPATLLPQRGPQAAGVKRPRPAPAAQD